MTDRRDGIARGRQRGGAPARAALVALSLCVALTRADLAHGQVLAQYDYEDLEFRGIGVEASRVWPQRVEPTTGFGIRLDLGLIGPRVRIIPSARFWGSSLKDAEVERLAQQIVLVCERQVSASCPSELDLGEVKLSDLELVTDAQFILVPGRLEPYVGIGLALHLLNGRGDFIDGTFVEDLLDSIAPGIGALAGLRFELLSALHFGAEARVMIASDVRYAGVTVGGVWSLPTPRPPATASADPR